MIWSQDLCAKETFSERSFYEEILKILAEISSIQRQGFVSHTDVSRMPVINKFLSMFTDSPIYIENDKSTESYKWIFNIIILNLYLAIITLKTYVLESEGKTSDFYADLKVLGNHLHDLLEPSIRLKLSKNGISVVQHIIGALDTEYQNVSETENELLSIQMAGHTVTYLRIPIHEPWEFVTVHTLTGKKYPMQNLDLESVSDDTGRLLFEYELVKTNINCLVTSTRKALYGEFDQEMLDKVAFLKSQQTDEAGVPRFLNFNKAGFENFRLPPTQANQWITMCDAKIAYRLEDQIRKLEGVFQNDLNDSYEFVRRILLGEPFNSSNGISNLTSIKTLELEGDSQEWPPLKYNSRIKLYESGYG